MTRTSERRAGGGRRGRGGDGRSGAGVVLALALVGCGGAPPPVEIGVPASPATEAAGAAGAAAPTGSAAAKAAPVAAIRQVLLGEMCSDRANGRPAVSLVAARQVGWSDDPGELEDVARRAGSRPFAVLSNQGKRVGVFTGVGSVDMATERPALTGGYGGAPACLPEDKECAEAQGHCALAVASLAADGVDDAPDLVTSGACVDGDDLVLDLDRDGRGVRFSKKAFLDEVRAPADEVVGAPAVGQGECAPRFQATGLVRGKDQKAFRALDLLGVVDLDSDGRLELVMQYRYASVRTWAVYGADGDGRRLVLRAEVAPWAGE